jgi:hypothetical protein
MATRRLATNITIKKVSIPMTQRFSSSPKLPPEFQSGFVMVKKWAISSILRQIAKKERKRKR